MFYTLVDLVDLVEGRPEYSLFSVESQPRGKCFAELIPFHMVGRSGKGAAARLFELLDVSMKFILAAQREFPTSLTSPPLAVLRLVRIVELGRLLRLCTQGVLLHLGLGALGGGLGRPLLDTVGSVLSPL